MSADAPVRVVLADDHPMYRYGVAAVLASEPRVELVGEAQSGRELLALVERTGPDVVVTDLRMPDLDGIAVTRELGMTNPDLPVLVLTMHDDDESVFGAMRAGARGYLLKGADADELIATIRTVAAGGTAFGPSVARRIVGFYLESTSRFAQGAFPELTTREREVLDLLAAGRRNSAIAATLGLSDKTVRNHLSAILTKLQVSDRSAAIVRAREAGLGRER
ncbi:response regulator [Flexivirga oryzae]|uniref:DNA-binding NarL/FixJ family response regulator n=1 Tax=Flexivirga oryzae TaxID=1794944 RepID=A0A839MXC7_9MICO|nr:DNA-binding NarL/FixJ family response regulator [Flexivirga oryzae]MBB2894510.1 DNA-binding NarL/FixJ family response regulator [Flexivirga oryzae]